MYCVGSLGLCFKPKILVENKARRSSKNAERTDRMSDQCQNNERIQRITVDACRLSLFRVFYRMCSSSHSARRNTRVANSNIGKQPALHATENVASGPI